ncbi:MAG TPA: HAD family phosphatase [Spirochaetia bacterium]|nr:HAD family phosphatase [Spirochaetia bacterium]
MNREIAVIFDLDGTVVDSEEIYREADRIFLARHGIKYTVEMWQNTLGIGSQAMISMMHEQIGLHYSAENLLKEKNDIYLELAATRTRAFPEMVNLIEQLSELGIPLAVATGSSIAVVDAVLAITGLRNRFEVIVSSEEVPRGKPAPDVFLEAARRLGADASVCTVIEDSQYGVEAAVTGGMSCIAVPTVQTRPLPDSFMRAGLLFESGMSEFSAEKAFQWILSTRTKQAVTR